MSEDIHTIIETEWKWTQTIVETLEHLHRAIDPHTTEGKRLKETHDATPEVFREQIERHIANLKDINVLLQRHYGKPETIKIIGDATFRDFLYGKLNVIANILAVMREPSSDFYHNPTYMRTFSLAQEQIASRIQHIAQRLHRVAA